MKKNKLIYLGLILALSACTTTDYWKLRIEIPRKVEVDLTGFNNIIVGPFLIKEKSGEIDLNKEIVEYFVGELERKVDKTILVTEIPLAKEEQLSSPDFWKSLDSDSEGTLYITGSALYTQETRKALIKKGRKRYEDPFENPAVLEERKFYNLDLALSMIDGRTGAPVFEREFKETKSYTNPNQTSYNAFFDLILMVKEKLFRSILGEGRLEERYLIIKNKD